VHAEYDVIEAGVDINDQAVISDTLAARAQALRASYMVMGGYNHSRAGEYVFGGVTRTMLSEGPVPLVMAH
jgi:nucleotide-binding universal stress UspA family protein